MKRNRKIAALSKDISDCNGSLAYGDIGFGDGELNWICAVNKLHKIIRVTIFINGVETIQEIPKLEIMLKYKT